MATTSATSSSNSLPFLRRSNLSLSLPLPPRTASFRVRAFQRGDFESFKKRVVSGEAWRDAWRSANDGFEQFFYEARKTAERLDREYAVSRRIASATEVVAVKVREIDRDYEVSQKWRTFSLDFSRNWPRYRRQLNDFMDTPLGRGFVTIFFLWFALSGWLFRTLIIATWVLPIAGPLLLGAVANNLVVKGACPSCKREFIGSKSSVVRCSGCGNIVWQPQGDFFSGNNNFNKGTPKSKSGPEIIDVEFEEK